MTVSRRQKPAFRPRSSKIRNELETAASRIAPKQTQPDRIAGHGVKFQNDEEGLLLPSARQAWRQATLIPIAEVYQELQLCGGWREGAARGRRRTTRWPAQFRSVNGATGIVPIGPGNARAPRRGSRFPFAPKGERACRPDERKHGACSSITSSKDCRGRRAPRASRKEPWRPEKDDAARSLVDRFVREFRASQQPETPRAGSAGNACAFGRIRVT